MDGRVEVQKASAPFDDAGADTILRTCDGVHFYVYRIVLSLGSPFFKSMFSLTQPASPAGTLTSPKGQPIIDVQENSRTLDHLLRLCYPIPDPVIQAIGDIGDVLEAAMKYEMEQSITLMKKLLHKGSADQPLEVFAVACRLDMEEEAVAAARTWRTTMPYIPERPVGRNGTVDWSRTVAGQTYIEPMAQISAGAYFRLLRFIRTDEVPNFCNPGGISTDALPPLTKAIPTNLPDFDGEPDIIIRSSDDVDFSAHKSIISFASSMLSNGIALPTTSKSLPTVQVDEHSAVLNVAIQLCYPLEDPVLIDPNLAIQLLRYATAHKARRAKDYVRRHLNSLSGLHPLRMFFIAAAQGWEAEARTAVLLALHSNIESTYVPEMEQVSARVYRTFLKHHYECFRKVADITYQNTYSTSESVLPKNHPIAHLTDGYARIAPAVYSPIVHHAVSITKANPFQITHNFEAMWNDSERVLDEIQIALEEVSTIP